MSITTYIDWPEHEILVRIASASILGVLECINLNIYAADVISRHHLQSKRYLKDNDQNNCACFIYFKCKHVTKTQFGNKRFTKVDNQIVHAFL